MGIWTQTKYIFLNFWQLYMLVGRHRYRATVCAARLLLLQYRNRGWPLTPKNDHSHADFSKSHSGLKNRYIEEQKTLYYHKIT